jgi:hypothetical protein
MLIFPIISMQAAEAQQALGSELDVLSQSCRRLRIRHSTASLSDIQFNKSKHRDGHAR